MRSLVSRSCASSRPVGLPHSRSAVSSNPLHSLRTLRAQFLAARPRLETPFSGLREAPRRALSVVAMAAQKKGPSVFGEAQEEASLPFISRRSAVIGVRGMVACSQPLAAEVSTPHCLPLAQCLHRRTCKLGSP